MVPELGVSRPPTTSRKRATLRPQEWTRSNFDRKSSIMRYRTMIQAGSAYRSALPATAFAGPLRRKAPAPRRFARATTCAQGDKSNRGEAEDDKLPNLRRRLILGGLSGTLVNACPCCSQIGINFEKPALADEWGYSAKDGPRTWGGTCAIGRQQSPINLPICPGATVPGPDGLGTEMDSDTLAGVADFDLNADEPLPETELKFQYAKDQPVMVKNNGHGSPQVDFSKDNVLTVGDRKYQLRQYHFHTPSEHAFHGKRFVMEAHLVHQDINSGELAVVGVMLKRGGTVPVNGLRTALDTVRTAVRLREPFVPANVSPISLIPTPPPTVHGGKHTYVHYQGSLTTPPCSEGVQWFVLSTPLEVTDAEVLDFAEFAGGRRGFGVNSRPLQSLGSRYMELVGIL